MVTWMRGAGINHRVIGEMPFGPRLTGLELHAGSVLSEHFQSLGRMTDPRAWFHRRIEELVSRV
jgi:hypothetical protein